MPEPGGPGGPLAPPIFGRSVNPIRTREGRLSPPITIGPLNVFHLPASLLKPLWSRKLVDDIYLPFSMSHVKLDPQKPWFINKFNLFSLRTAQQDQNSKLIRQFFLSKIWSQKSLKFLDCLVYVSAFKFQSAQQLTKLHCDWRSSAMVFSQLWKSHALFWFPTFPTGQLVEDFISSFIFQEGFFHRLR